MAKSVAKIKAAFPSLAPGFYSVLIERMKDKGFSDERMVDAINSVIDNCQYPTPTLANFLSFDKRVKVLTYNEICSMVYKQEAVFSDYSKVKINDKLYWIRTSEKDLYGIQDIF